MKIILSPAKKMRIDCDSLAVKSLPTFLDSTTQILDILKQMSYDQLKALWKCNDNIARQNEERISAMDLYHNLTPAIMSYDGLAFLHIAPSAFTQGQLDYLADHLIILSGFYGAVRAFDGVTPYRLEMQAKLPIDGHKDLYAFWGNRLAEFICNNEDTIINLASKEYSKTIEPYVPDNVTFITCIFAINKDGKLVEQGTACKMARGEMVRFMAENNIQNLDDIKQFNGQNFIFSKEHSNDKNYVFIKGGK